MSSVIIYLCAVLKTVIIVVFSMIVSDSLADIWS